MRPRNEPDVRVVIDTNVLVSGLLWQGTPGELVDRVYAREIELVTSATLFAELEDVLTRPKFLAKLVAIGSSSQELLDVVRQASVMVSVGNVEPVIADDPDDDHVLACAVAGQAAVIVSGDHHLLDLSSYRDIRILTAAALLEELDNPG